MAERAKKTEHSGAKHGNGAYWGPKADAKSESNRVRREDDRRIRQMVGDTIERYGDVLEHLGRD